MKLNLKIVSKIVWTGLYVKVQIISGSGLPTREIMLLQELLEKKDIKKFCRSQEKWNTIKKNLSK